MLLAMQGTNYTTINGYPWRPGKLSALFNVPLDVVVALGATTAATAYGIITGDTSTALMVAWGALAGMSVASIAQQGYLWQETSKSQINFSQMPIIPAPQSVAPKYDGILKDQTADYDRMNKSIAAFTAVAGGALLLWGIGTGQPAANLLTFAAPIVTAGARCLQTIYNCQQILRGSYTFAAVSAAVPAPHRP